MTDTPFQNYDVGERVRLVESDLALTNEFVKGVVATSTAIRGVGATVWLALLGVSLQQGNAWLAVLALVVAGVFWLVDGYYGWLYLEASVHARACESVLSTYYDAISRFDDDPGTAARLKTKLRTHRFGLFLAFRGGYGWKQWWRARPTFLYRTMYLALVVLPLFVVVLVATGLVAGSKAR